MSRSDAVVLTGGTGSLGRHLRPALKDREVILLSRRRPELQANERWVPADLAELTALPPVPSGSSLCHLAYDRSQTWPNLRLAGNVVEATNACPAVENVVVVSTTSVYGSGPQGTVDESSPCRPTDDYARVKLAGEQLWRDRLRDGCRLTILRPSAILTPDAAALPTMFADALHRPLRAGAKRAMQGGASVHVVAVDTVVGAVLFALDRRQGPREAVFLVTNDEAPENASYAALQDAIRAAAGRRPLRVPSLPRAARCALGRLLGQPLATRSTFSSAALTAAGFAAPGSLAPQLAQTVRTVLAASPGAPGAA